MSEFSIPLTRLVHENLSIVMCYAYSLNPLTDLVEKRFAGEWKYLNKGLFGLSQIRAEKALLELALFLRTLDDEEKITDHLTFRKLPNDCGRLIFKSGKKEIAEVLPFREVANKIIHSRRLEWRMIILRTMDGPKTDDGAVLYCYPRAHQVGGKKNKAWIRAEIDLVALTEICGLIAH